MLGNLSSEMTSMISFIHSYLTFIPLLVASFPVVINAVLSLSDPAIASSIFLSRDLQRLGVLAYSQQKVVQSFLIANTGISF